MTGVEYRAANKEKRAAQRKAYYEAHKAEELSRCKAYRAAHIDEMKAYDKAYKEAHKEQTAASQKSYRAAHRDERKVYQDAWYAAHPTAMSESGKRMRLLYPEKTAARRKVRTEVRSGRYPPPNAMVCRICGEAQAQQYHHHNGYGPGYELDVIAVCKECHKEAHKEKAK